MEPILDTKNDILKKETAVDYDTIPKMTINFGSILRHPIISFKKALHPFMLAQMPKERDFELKFINEKPEVEGPVLYLVTHNNCHDAPVTCEAIEEHSYILVGRQPLKLRDRLFFNINGQVKIDRDDKKDGQKASKKIVNRLKAGVNVIMFPEKTWNPFPSTPINHEYWGWVDIAKESKATVVPLALEYYELSDRCCYINFGQPFRVNEADVKEEKNNQLEDTLASLKFEIWNQFPMQERSKTDLEIWKKTMERRYREYPKLNRVKEMSYIRGIENHPDYVFGSLGFELNQEKSEENKKLR